MASLSDLAKTESNEPVRDPLDPLQFGKYVDVLVSVIRSKGKDDGPLAIGIYGPWGSGKTYLLKKIEDRLTPPKNSQKKQRRGKKQDEPKAHVVLFSAWQIAAGESVWPSLVHHLVSELNKKLPLAVFSRNLRRNLRRQFIRDRGLVALSVLCLLVVLIALVAESGVAGGNIISAFLALGAYDILRAIVKSIDQPLGERIAALLRGSDYGRPQAMFEDIEDDLAAINKALAPSNSTAVILIDDLDRCDPSKAIEMLKSVHLLSGLSRAVVCIAIDPRLVTSMISKNLDFAGNSDQLGFEYLDKIVQIPFRIPQPTADEIKSFIDGLKDSFGPTVGIFREDRPDSKVARIASRLSEFWRHIFKKKDSGKPQGKPKMLSSEFWRYILKKKDLEKLQGTSKELSPDEVSAPAPSSLMTPLASPTKESTGQKDPLDVFSRGFGSEAAESWPLAFREEEFAAVRDIADFLRPNPRFLKRLISVYRLVCFLAFRRSIQQIDPYPYLTVGWLVICAQWPRFALRITSEFRRVKLEKTENLGSKPLSSLLSAVREQETDEKQDGEWKAQAIQLGQLIELIENKRALRWKELSDILRFTMHFNPATELGWGPEWTEGETSLVGKTGNVEVAGDE